MKWHRAWGRVWLTCFHMEVSEARRLCPLYKNNYFACPSQFARSFWCYFLSLKYSSSPTWTGCKQRITCGAIYTILIYIYIIIMLYNNHVHRQCHAIASVHFVQLINSVVIHLMYCHGSGHIKVINWIVWKLLNYQPHSGVIKIKQSNDSKVVSVYLFNSFTEVTLSTLEVWRTNCDSIKVNYIYSNSAKIHSFH